MRPKLRALVLLALATVAAPAQQGPEKGGFLVARENLGDPNFSRSVVLILDYSADGAMGVIVNRPTNVPLSDLLPKLKRLEGRPDLVYLGGPVDPSGLLLVVRSSAPVPSFRHVHHDLYTGADVDTLEGLLAKGVKPDAIRAYVGYAGWGPGQLDREIERGSWILSPTAVAPVFDPQPHSLWRKLIDGALVRFAWLGSSELLH